MTDISSIGGQLQVVALAPVSLIFRLLLLRMRRNIWFGQCIFYNTKDWFTVVGEA